MDIVGAVATRSRQAGVVGHHAHEAADRLDTETVLARLKDPQRDIVRSISIEGAGIRETAVRLKMTEVAVRVALHRALKSLAALYRSE